MDYGDLTAKAIRNITERLVINDAEEAMKHKKEYEYYRDNPTAAHMRRKIICAVCNRSEAISYSEAIEDGWVMREDGMVCRQCHQKALEDIISIIPRHSEKLDDNIEIVYDPRVESLKSDEKN